MYVDVVFVIVGGLYQFVFQCMVVGVENGQYVILCDNVVGYFGYQVYVFLLGQLVDDVEDWFIVVEFEMLYYCFVVGCLFGQLFG